MTDTSPTLRIEFELSAADIAFFRDRLHASRKKWSLRDEGTVVEKAKALVDEAIASKPPSYVVERIEKLQTMLGMLTDHDWDLKGEDREHVFDMLAYFADPKDIIPDNVPGLGYLDDAIVIELVAVELAPEMAAYKEFLANMEELKAGRADAASLEDSREYLHRRIRRQRRRRAGSGGADGAMTSLFSSSGG